MPTCQFNVGFNVMPVVCLKGCKVIMIVHSVFHKAILNTYKVSIKTFNWIKQPCLAMALKVGRYLLLMLMLPSVNLESAQVWQAASTDVPRILLFYPRKSLFLGRCPNYKTKPVLQTFVAQLCSLQVWRWCDSWLVFRETDCIGIVVLTKQFCCVVLEICMGNCRWSKWHQTRSRFTVQGASPLSAQVGKSGN